MVIHKKSVNDAHLWPLKHSTARVMSNLASQQKVDTNRSIVIKIDDFGVES